MTRSALRKRLALATAVSLMLAWWGCVPAIGTPSTASELGTQVQTFATDWLGQMLAAWLL